MKKMLVLLLLSFASLSAIAGEYSHEPIHILCTDVHAYNILELGINPKAEFLGLQIPNQPELNLISSSIDIKKVYPSKEVEDFLKIFTVTAKEPHFAFDSPPTRRPAHYVGAKVVTLSLTNTGNEFEVSEFKIEEIDANEKVLSTRTIDFTQYRLPGCTLTIKE